MRLLTGGKSRFIVLTASVLCDVQSEHFSFLGVNNQSNLSDMRCRTTFYTALGRLLMVDLGTFFFLFLHAFSPPFLLHSLSLSFSLSHTHSHSH